MSQYTQLEKLVDKFLNEVFVKEGTVEVPTMTGTSATLTTDQKKTVTNARKDGDNVKYVKKTEPVTEKKSTKDDETKDVEEPVEVEQEPKSQLEDLKTQIQSIVSSLESMDDFKIGDKEDLKAKKLINKIKLKLDDVILAIDDLTGIKSGLDEQKESKAMKGAEKSSKVIEKHITKIIKDPEIAARLAKKATPLNIRKIEQKVGKELDAKQLATAIVKASLKEVYQNGIENTLKLRQSINEEYKKDFLIESSDKKDRSQIKADLQKVTDSIKKFTDLVDKKYGK